MAKLRENIGLSEYEAKIYLCLIQAGPLTAGKISLMTGIPRTKVYAALGKLIDMGLVVERPQFPRTYAPSPPAKAFGNYLKEYERKTKGLFSVISFLEKTFSERTENDVFENGVIWVIKGQERIFEKMEDMLAKARGSVEIETDEKGSVLLFKKSHQLLDRLGERSVRTHLVTRFGDHNRYVVGQLQHVLKVIDADIRLPLIAVNVDKKHFLVAVMESVDLSDCETSVAIFSDNQILAGVIRSLICSQGNQNTLTSKE